jgi:hypothetical protein
MNQVEVKENGDIELDGELIFTAKDGFIVGHDFASLYWRAWLALEQVKREIQEKLKR